MWFDANAALAEIGAGQDNETRPPATIATLARYIAPNVADVATPSMENRRFDHSRHGLPVAGNPLTWTGRVVSLEDWRRLTAWDRHGPDGRIWCGLAKKWVYVPDT